MLTGNGLLMLIESTTGAVLAFTITVIVCGLFIAIWGRQ